VTELSNITLVTYWLQVVVITCQLFHYLSRYFDRTRLRFLLFSLLYLAFNSLWIFPQFYWGMNQALSESLLVYFGVFLGCYTYFYLNKELGIKEGKLKLKHLAISLILFSLGIQFANLFLTQFYNDVARVCIYICFEGVLIYQLFQTVRHFFNPQDKRKHPMFWAGLSVICVGLFLPVFFLGVDNPTIRNLYINSSFLLISAAYLKQSFAQSAREYLILDPTRNFSQLNLTDRYFLDTDKFHGYNFNEREREIALLILDGMRTQEIADQLNLSYNTIRGYIRTMNKKVGVVGRKEFQEKFNQTRI
jgi:DNA-binding CsgD family transcriptional regulator